MKMLGFMIAMTLVYWVMATYAHSIITTADPCPSAEFVTAGTAADYEPTQMSAAESAAVKLSGRWSAEGDYHIVETANACAG